MRMMMRWTVPVEKGNEAIKDGSLARTVEALLEKIEPEAAYFHPHDGRRAGTFVFDIQNPSQVAEIAEPMLLNLNAAVEWVPVMNADDLRKGLEGLAS